MQTDQVTKLKLLESIAAAAIYAANGTKTGATIDSAGYESLTFALQSGALTDGTWTSAVYGSNDSGMAGEVQLTGTDLIGSDPSFAITDDNVLKSVGVNLAKLAQTYRYFRQKATQAAASTGGFLCGQAILGSPRFAPVS